jgi:hypothetical protein
MLVLMMATIAGGCFDRHEGCEFLEPNFVGPYRAPVTIEVTDESSEKGPSG